MSGRKQYGTISNILFFNFRKIGVQLLDNTISQQKSFLRSRMRAAARGLPREYFLAAGQAICRGATLLPAWQKAASVFCFVSTPWEPDTSLLLQLALQEGRKLALPRITGPGRMEAVIVEDLASLRPGPFGIPEPMGSETLEPSDIDFALVPCLAASPDGLRLGHGGGYYDRFLPFLGGEWAIACCRFQLQTEIPVLAHDCRASVVVTENGILL